MPKTKEFKLLERSLSKEYLGRPVPKQYQYRYGKYYDRDDVKQLSYAVAITKGIKIERKK